MRNTEVGENMECVDTEVYEDQHRSGAMLHEDNIIWRRKDYREKKHNTAEQGEWKLNAPTLKREKAEEAETL